MSCGYSFENGFYTSERTYQNWGSYVAIACGFGCNAGYYRKDDGNCAPCAFGYYSNRGDTVCQQCSYTLISSQSASDSCPAGKYATFNPADKCKRISCTTCSTSPAGKYYSLSSDTATYYYSSKIFAPECATANCLVCAAGYKLENCGGANAGNCVSCGTNLLTGIGSYYSSGCTTATCATCSVAGTYNSLCPVSNGVTAGDCSGVCAPAIANGKFMAPSTTAYVTSAAACPFTCNAGFYVSGRACAACGLSSSNCPNGTYRETCNVLTGADSSACSACTGKPATGTVWATSASSWGAQACRWMCDATYYLDPDRSSSTCYACVDTGATRCLAGYRLDMPCLQFAGNWTKPTCVKCADHTLKTYIQKNTNQCEWTCNTGYWSETSATECKLWSSATQTCDAGSYLSTATATSDRVCTPCPNAAVGNRFYTPNTCDWQCRSGTALNASNACTRCNGGYYKAGNGNASSLCVRCPTGQYQPFLDLPVACTAVPSNAITNTDQTNYQCIGGYLCDRFLATCTACSQAISNHVSVTYRTDYCDATALVCKTSYYRQLSPANCVLCPSATNAASTTVVTTTVAALLGTAPASDPADERNAVCAIPSSCNTGYYRQSVATASGKTQTVTCEKCSEPTCAAGEYKVLCTGDAKANTCGKCNTVGLNPTEAYGVNCVKVCAAGYYYYASSCVMCDVGKYKSNVGNDASCTPCPVGTYTNHLGTGTCTPCPPGTYASAVGTTACTPCSGGLNGPAGASTPCTTSYDLFGISCGMDLRRFSLTTSVAIGGNMAIDQDLKACSLSPQGDFMLYHTFNGHAVYKHTFATNSRTLIAGDPAAAGFANGQVGVSRLNQIGSVTISSDGAYALLADRLNHAIRKLWLLNNSLITLVGSGTSGYVEGANPRFNAPVAICLSYDNTFALIFESGGNRLRKLDMATLVSSLIGGDNWYLNGQSTVTDGAGAAARFNLVYDIAIKPDNTWAYVAHYFTGQLRSINIPEANTLTMATNFQKPTGIIAARDYVLVAESVTTKITKVAIGSTVWMTASNGDIQDMDAWRCGLKGYGSTAQAGCIQCPAGTYSPGYGVCAPCAAGTISAAAGATACTLCVTGTFSASPGLAVCTACSVGSQNSQAGSTSCLSSAGYYTDKGGAILACPAGSYYAVVDHIFPTSFTSSFMMYSLYSATGDFTFSQQYCGGFPVYTGRAAVDITYGYISYYSVTCYCIPEQNSWFYARTETGWCPNTEKWQGPTPGTINGLLSQARNTNFCTACTTAGTYAYPPGQTACATCPYDFYCPTTSAAPIACPLATPYTVAMGNTAVTQCLANLFKPCRAGYFWMPTDSDQRCTPCAGATYCADSVITACAPAANDAWYAPPKATGPADCVLKSITTGTVACPLNTIAPPNGATDRWQCRAAAGYFFVPGLHSAGQQCPVGYYCPQAALVPVLCNAAAPCTEWGKKAVAVRCPAGSAAQLPVCQPCPSLPPYASLGMAGACEFCCNTGYVMTSATACAVAADSTTCASSTQYMPEPPNPSCMVISTPTCQACPVVAGATLTTDPTYRRQMATRLWGTAACVYECPLGYYMLQSTTTCVACAPGKYQAKKNDPDCTVCPYGTYSSVVAATACVSCGPYGFPSGGTQCTCVGGAYVVGGTCVACSLGSVTPTAGTCYPCPPGRVCSLNSNLSSTTACSAYFDPQVAAIKPNGDSTCIACPRGSIAANLTNAHKQCVPCAPGTYQSGSLCVPCPANTFSASAGAYSVQACVPCTSPFVAASGSAACVCPANYFQATTTTCTRCRASCMAGASFVRTCPMGSLTDVSLCACNGNNTVGDGMTTNCTTSCPAANACGCAQGLYYSLEQKRCLACRTWCPPPSTLAGACAKGTAISDTVRCLCPVNTYWTGSGCMACRRCTTNAALIIPCVAGSTQDTTVCRCNAGYVGNGISYCRPNTPVA